MTDKLNADESFKSEGTVTQGLYDGSVNKDGTITRKSLQITTDTLPSSSAPNQEVKEEVHEKQEIQGEIVPNEPQLNQSIHKPHPQMEIRPSIQIRVPYYDEYSEPRSDCIFAACLACIFGTILTPIFGLCILTFLRGSFSMSGALIGTSFPLYFYGIGKFSNYNRSNVRSWCDIL
jgi:hypothetical protein